VTSSNARVAAMVQRLRQAEHETLGEFTVRDLIERVSGGGSQVTARDSRRDRAAGET
jgi:hypothetical protein